MRHLKENIALHVATAQSLRFSVETRNFCLVQRVPFVPDKAQDASFVYECDDQVLIHLAIVAIAK